MANKEYIEREAAIKQIKANKKWSHDPSTMDYAIELVKTIPTADVVERSQIGKEIFTDFDLTVQLELEKAMDGKRDEMFYRYAIGDFKLWFVQNIENGNIYSVALREQGEELSDFNLYIFADEEANGGYYPNNFSLSGHSSSMLIEDVPKYMENMAKACAILKKVEEFFKTSKHYELFNKLCNGTKSVEEVLKDAEARCSVAETEKDRDIVLDKE